MRVSRWRWIGLVGAGLVLALPVAACLPTATPLPEGTLRGLVVAGPTCPVETEPPDPACADRPVSGALILALRPDGSEAGRASSAPDGTFTLRLPLGTYLLAPQQVEGLMGTPVPLEVNLTRQAPVATVDIGYDTGIR